MSSIFQKAKGDLHYLFKSNSQLSPKGRKRKQRAVRTFSGLILVLIQVILLVLFLLKIFSLELLPAKYLVMLNVVLILITLYTFTSQFTKAHILGKVISVLMSVVLLVGFLYAAKLSSTLGIIAGKMTKTDIIDVIVLKDDPATSIADALSYTFGYNSTVNSSVTTKAISDIEAENNTSLSTKTYTKWDDLLNNLYNGKNIEAFVVHDSVRSTIAEHYPEFEEKTKIIGTIKITTEVKLSANDKKVNQEPFFVYVSGNDGEGQISSIGRSDVNILAVVNPKTKQVLLVSTPRDSYITISTADGKSGLDKLTHAGNAGIEYSEEALENLYSISIDYYIKLNFTGCVEIVDALGGITINSDVDFTNGYEAAPESYHFSVGENECNGEQTLAFVRERKAFDDGDFQRGRNQEAAIKGIIAKATSPSILTNYSAVLDAVSNMVLTNMSTGTITSLIRGQLSNPKAWNVQSYTISGTTDTMTGQVYGISGMSVVIPDKSSINTAKELINNVVDGINFDVTDYK